MQSNINPHSVLLIYYQNVRGLNTKTIQFYNAVSTSNYSVIALTESWLHSAVKNVELFNTDAFSVYRCDRDVINTNYNHGGGVLLAIDSSVHSIDLRLKETTNFKNLYQIDIVGVKIKIDYYFCFILLIYIPPNVHVDLYNSIFDTISSLEYLHNRDVIILGDFNITDYSTYLNTLEVNNSVLSLLNFFNFLELEQHNFVYNHNNRLLDLVLSNKKCEVNRALDILITEDLHHPSIDVSVTVSKQSKNNNKLKINIEHYNFRRANLIGLYQNLAEIDWTFLRSFSDANIAFERFYTKLYTSLDAFVPKTKARKAAYPPWFTTKIIRLIKLKYKALRDYKTYSDPIALEEFKLLRRYIKEEVNLSYKNYCNLIENNITNNPNKFWQFVNTKRRDHSIPSTMSYKNDSFSTPENIVNAFSDYFQESFVISNIEPNNSFNELVYDNLSLEHFTEDEVLACLKKIKPKTTMGPDMIPAFLLHDCACVFSFPLTILFNLALKNNTFPDVLKNSKIIPVFKKGDRSIVENYRPITIINNFSKAFEILLYDPIFYFIKNKITQYQHGFMKGRSTTTNLFCITQTISDAIDNNSQVDVIYTDLSKAFDRLNHNILLLKLHNFGLSVDLISFFKSYLQERKQFVECCGHQSVDIMAYSGVPQGSVLGPLFFNIFINDIVDGLTAVSCLLYADDMKIFRNIDDINDCHTLQAALDHVNEWCLLNKLPLNASKCNVMSFSLKHNIIEYDYSVGATALTKPKAFRDLGVIFDSKLSFTNHINAITSECSKSLGSIIRNSRDFMKINTLKLLYFSFVRSRVEYCSVIWSPQYNVHIINLEKLQRRFLKYISFRVDGVYPYIGFPQSELLNRFTVNSLANRRVISQLIFLYKVIHNFIDCSDILDRVNFHVPRLSSRHRALFSTSTPRTNVQRFSPLFQVCDNYNNLAKQFDIFHCSVASIKSLSL